MRCKFRLDSITHQIGTVGHAENSRNKAYPIPVHGKVSTVVFHPVYHKDDPNHENSKFWAQTPGGELKLDVVNAAAVDGLEVGAEYFLDITPAAKEVP